MFKSLQVQDFETQVLASLRFHVEKLFDGVMPLSLAHVASKCFMVVRLLINQCTNELYNFSIKINMIFYVLFTYNFK